MVNTDYVIVLLILMVCTWYINYYVSELLERSEAPQCILSGWRSGKTVRTIVSYSWITDQHCAKWSEIINWVTVVWHFIWSHKHMPCTPLGDHSQWRGEVAKGLPGMWNYYLVPIFRSCHSMPVDIMCCDVHIELLYYASLLYRAQIGQQRTKFTWGKNSVMCWSTWCGWPTVAISTYQQLLSESSNWTLKSTHHLLLQLQAMIERVVGQSARIPVVLVRKLHWDCHVIRKVMIYSCSWYNFIIMIVPLFA